APTVRGQHSAHRTITRPLSEDSTQRIVQSRAHCPRTALSASYHHVPTVRGQHSAHRTITRPLSEDSTQRIVPSRAHCPRTALSASYHHAPTVRGQHSAHHTLIQNIQTVEYKLKEKQQKI